VPFDKKSFVVPDGTRFEEHTVVAPGDVVLGNHVRFEFGVATKGRIFGGENVHVDGHLKTPADLRLDHFCRISGTVEAGGNVYLGEKSRIEGKLVVGGDLDVGDDVAIAQGFEAKGWINIRNPVPIVIYLFIYLMELLRLGRSAEVERLLAELEAAQERIQIQEGFLYVPDGSTVGLTNSIIKGNLHIGKGCRILGNYVVHGNVNVGPESKVFGALRAAGTVRVQGRAEIQGTIESSRGVQIGEEVRVLGDVRAETVDMFHSAVVDGRVVAPGGIRFSTQQSLAMQEKVERYAAGIRDDIVDLLS
jgi:predicted acyltransferase (DUF342 family)